MICLEHLKSVFPRKFCLKWEQEEDLLPALGHKKIKWCPHQGGGWVLQGMIASRGQICLPPGSLAGLLEASPMSS